MARKASESTTYVPAFLSKMQRDGKAVVAAELANNAHTDIELNPVFDWVTGKIPENRLVVISGPYQSFKTGLSLLAAGRIQQRYPDSLTLILDTEFNQDSVQAQRLPLYGLDPARTFIVQSNVAEDLFAHLDDIDQDEKNNIRSIIIDSWGGLSSNWTRKKLASGDVEAAGTGKQGGDAKLIGALMKEYCRIAHKRNITVFMISHAYEETDQWKKMKHPWIIAGGQKLRYHARSIVFVEKLATKEADIASDNEIITSKDEKIKTGSAIRIKCIKSNRTVEGKTADLYIDFTKCCFVRENESLFELAERLKVIQRPNVQTYAFGGKSFRGRDVALAALEQPDVKQALIKLINDNPYGILHGSAVEDSEACKAVETQLLNEDELEI